MGLLDKLWDDVVAGPQPDHGLNRLRRQPNPTPPQNVLNDPTGQMDQRGLSEGRVSQSIAITKPPSLSSSLEREGWSPSSPSSASPSTPPGPGLESPIGREKDNVWRSVFHPGRNHHMKKLGSQKFDKAESNSPTVYDWLYSKDSKSTWR